MRQNFDLSALRKKLLPPGPVLDVHVHPFPVPRVGPQATPRQAADFLIKQADAAGVSRMVLMNLGRTWNTSPTNEACAAANDLGLEVQKLAPDRFICFAYVNPADPDAARAELDRQINRNGMLGMKLWVAVRASDKRVISVVRHAADLGVPVLQHVWIKAGGNQGGESSPEDLAELAAAVPEARIIMGHLGGAGFRGIENVRNLKNVYAETGGSEPETGIVEQAVERLGPGRVIFGSDTTGRQMAVQLGKVLGANLPDEVKKRILWDNLVSILPAKAGLKPKAGDAGANPCEVMQ
jgi:predicted TIM-barrel fold metal-dependent hydrolase